MNRLALLDTCVVSDALDHLGISGAVVGVQPMWGRPKAVGRARTVEVVDAAAVGPKGTTPQTPPQDNQGEAQPMAVTLPHRQSFPPGPRT
jgi:regulator of RNase E activity RraA